ncbi:beta-lactamase family protein [Ancylobacter sp. A5.8]|uniref:serine hydrolase domain-containing protein n=1 Tax=Ancylobacter gelatini TaxID=2919920 RepID=UPI001F4E83B4|nr:serine hydrolase [Ancylobacter gelatini]MCJ8143961.1 beta-lactamase family protein [Ancylobacter gelatini]
MKRRSLLAAPLLLLTPRLAVGQGSPPEPASPDAAPLTPILDRAASLSPLRTILVSKDGTRIAARAYRGLSLEGASNIKSASKSIIAMLAGIAIGKGVLEGPDQKIVPLLRADLPADPDPRLNEITLGNLLSMQAGLERTSGAYYGRWIASRNWVRAALARPFVDEPGGEMLYSTGSTHLISAILTRTTGRSTLALARDWLGGIEGFSITSWERDPQGIYFGGNQMAMRPSSLLAFAECCRNGGRNRAGQQVIPESWIAECWRVRTASRFTGDGYGYGWFTRELAGQAVHYGWGYGGQMLYVVPARGLSIVMTSDADTPSGRTGHRDDLHALAAEIVSAAG